MYTCKPMEPHMRKIQLENTIGRIKKYCAHALDFGVLLLFVRYTVLMIFTSRLVREDFRRKGLGEENISWFYRLAAHRQKLLFLGRAW